MHAKLLVGGKWPTQANEKNEIFFKFFSFRELHSPYIFSPWVVESSCIWFGAFLSHTEFSGSLTRWLLSLTFCEGSHLVRLPEISVYDKKPPNQMQLYSPSYKLKKCGEWSSPKKKFRKKISIFFMGPCVGHFASPAIFHTCAPLLKFIFSLHFRKSRGVDFNETTFFSLLHRFSVCLFSFFSPPPSSFPPWAFSPTAGTHTPAKSKF